MTDQSNAAAERSAHVERGAGRRPPGESFLVEVTPGVFKLKAVVEAERERDAARTEAERLRAALRNLLGAVDTCKTMEVGAGGMSIEAQVKRTVYLRVPMWPFEEVRAALTEAGYD